MEKQINVRTKSRPWKRTTRERAYWNPEYLWPLETTLHYVYLFGLEAYLVRPEFLGSSSRCSSADWRPGVPGGLRLPVVQHLRRVRAAEDQHQHRVPAGADATGRKKVSFPGTLENV